MTVPFKGSILTPAGIRQSWAIAVTKIHYYNLRPSIVSSVAKKIATVRNSNILNRERLLQMTVAEEGFEPPTRGL